MSSQRAQSASAAPRQQKKKPFVDPLLQRKDEVSAESKASVCVCVWWHIFVYHNVSVLMRMNIVSMEVMVNHL